MKYYLDMWKNCFNFSGKTDKRGYWMAMLANLIVFVSLGVVCGVLNGLTTGGNGANTSLVFLPMQIYIFVTIIPCLSMTIRRLRDGGRQWGWILLWFVPLGQIVLIVMLCSASKAEPTPPVQTTRSVMKTAPASVGTGSTPNTGNLQALVAKCAGYTSLTLDRSEEQAMERELLSRGEPAFSAILSYLLFCATGAAPQGWWNNASSLVRLLLEFPGVDQARKTQALQTLAGRNTNIWEYHTQIKGAAEQELLKLKKADPTYRADGLISAEDAKAELDALFNIYDNNERIKKAAEMKPSAEHWPDTSKAYYYYILGDALRRRDATDRRQYAFYAAQLFYSPVNTSLGWQELRKLAEYKDLSATPENARLLHEAFPLPTSFDGLVSPAPSGAGQIAAKSPAQAGGAGPRFQSYTGTGVCDVCNASLAGKKAFIVPNPVFYRSKKYREHMRSVNAVMAALTGDSMDDAYFEKLLQRDRSPGSAVCEDCIHMFE